MFFCDQGWVTSMLVTDVGDQMCWWQVWDVGDRFRMLLIDLIHWENHQHNEKKSPTQWFCQQHLKSVTIKSVTISYQHKDVTNITVTPGFFSLLTCFFSLLTINYCALCIICMLDYEDQENVEILINLNN